MSHPIVVGNLVQIRKDISAANKSGSGLQDWNSIRESLVGRIAVVVRVDEDGTVKLYFGAPEHRGSGHVMDWWRIVWITVLTSADVEKMDARFVKTLRDDCAKAYPDITPSSSDKQAAVAKIKAIIADVRGKLTELERAVATLE